MTAGPRKDRVSQTNVSTSRIQPLGKNVADTASGLADFRASLKEVIQVEATSSGVKASDMVMNQSVTAR